MRRTCPRSSFIHCRGVRAVFFITPRFLNTAAMNDNAVYLFFVSRLRASRNSSRKLCIHAVFKSSVFIFWVRFF
jgi:hypothetical protein